MFTVELQNIRTGQIVKITNAVSFKQDIIHTIDAYIIKTAGDVKLGYETDEYIIYEIY